MSAILENEMATPDLAQWVASNAVDDRTADAIVDAIRQAHAHGIGHPGIDTIRTSAMIFRAPLRCVAAALGFLQCVHSGEWINLQTEPPAADEGTGCPRVGDAESLAVCRALCLWIAVGGNINTNHKLPRLVAERLKQLTATAPPEPLQSPGRDAKAS